MFTNVTGLIIPTRNRPLNLSSTLQFFFKKKINFSKIIVIDSSDKKFVVQIKNICSKFNVELYFSKPSTSQQRNIGLKKLINCKVEFIMFLDDDLKFYKNSFKIMDSYIKKYKNKYIGFCFNNYYYKKTKSLLEKIKVSKFFHKIGLYSFENGKILNNGWHTKIENIKKNTETQWLPTACSIYKKKILLGKYFDKSFGVYSYLEDLDFSLQINPSRSNIFLVVASAKFVHIKQVIRTSFVFGYYEFINRYKIVTKFHLNKNFFFVMAFLKIVLNAILIIRNYKNIFKLLGNIVGFITCSISNRILK